MAWVRVDDTITFHRKVVQAGNECTGAWLRMLAWSNQHGTDGVVIQEIAIEISKKQRVLDRLVEVGMLEVNNNLHGKSYSIHDFLEYQLSATEIKQRKDRISSVRARAGRAGALNRWGHNGNGDGKPDGKLPSITDNVLNGKNGKTMAPSPSPSPSHLKAKHSLTEASSTAQAAEASATAEADAGLGYFSKIGTGVQRVLDARDFERLLVEVGAQPVGPKWGSVMRTLSPFSRDELRMALAKARDEGKGKRIMPGLVLRIIERWRGEQPAVMMVPQPGTEWYESRKREEELLALERGRPPVREAEPEVDDLPVSTTGAEQARAIIASLASKMSIHNGK